MTKFSYFLNKLCSIYLILMLSVFLFVVNDGFYDITFSKYSFFIKLSLLFNITCAIGHILNRISSRNKLIDLNRLDISMILFLICCVLSTLFSPFMKQTIIGQSGRYMGLLSVVNCIFNYIFISRYFNQKMYILLVFMTSVSIVQIIGVVNFFGIDLFGFYQYLSDYQSNFFLSTIGNSNFFAILACFSLPLCLSFFIYSKEMQSKVIYFIYFIVNTAAIMISNSDGTHIAVILMLILIFCFLDSYDKIRKYLFSLLVFLVVPKMMGLLLFFISTGHYFHTISSIYVYDLSTWIFILFILFMLFYLQRHREELTLQCISRVKKNIFKYLVLSFFIFFVLIIFLNVFNFEMDTIINNYFKFNEDWGTGRGNIWMLMLQAWSESPLINILFGNGLETTRNVMFEYYENYKMMIYDNAHNEYIQYLLSIGLVGLASYLYICVNVVKILLKKIDKDPYALGLFGCVIAYFIQSFVNISQPITTPLLFIFFGLIGCYYRYSYTDNEND